MSTYALTVFIIGLVFMAIMGLVCGHYTLKFLKFLDKVEQEKAAKEKADALAKQETDHT